MTHEPIMFDPNTINIAKLDDETFRLFLWQALTDIRKDQQDVKARISSLEKFRWMSVGAVLVLAALVVPVFLDLVSKS